MATTIVGNPADHTPIARPVPRIALRTFWLLHRAMVRLSGRRFGLSRPEAGERFGMMRLTTLGHRSGATRVAIVGYYEDGPNLVTLAMNGWGKAEPAWWLNLQASPNATIDLPDGTRAVRARAASGEERDRLWANVREYPGWAPDIDASASLRPTPTAVVVLEPRGTGPEAPAGADDNALAVPSTAPDGTDRHRRLALRHLWLVPGIGLALVANAQSTSLNIGLVPILLFGIVPHLPAMAGIALPHAHGQMPPRAVPLFNAMHQPAVPIVLLGLAATGVLTPFWLVGTLAWLGHIVADWGLANGLRTPEGYPRGRRSPADRPALATASASR